MGIFGGGSNLPPGCRVSDIPGNRPEDEMWESIIENFWDKKRIKAMQRRGIIFLTHEQKTTMGRIWRRNAPRKYYAIQDSIDAYITVAITYGIELGNIGAEERQKEERPLRANVPRRTPYPIPQTILQGTPREGKQVSERNKV